MEANILIFLPKSRKLTGVKQNSSYTFKKLHFAFKQQDLSGIYLWQTHEFKNLL